MEGDWRTPFAAAAGLGMGLGVVMTAAEPRLLGHALLVSGALVLATGMIDRHGEHGLALAHGGALTMTVGIWIHLLVSPCGCKGAARHDQASNPLVVRCLSDCPDGRVPQLGRFAAHVVPDPGR